MLPARCLTLDRYKSWTEGSFEWVQFQVVLTPPVDQLSHLLSACRLVTVPDQTDYNGVVHILQEFHRRVPSGAIIGVEGEEQWGEDPTLGGASAAADSRTRSKQAESGKKDEEQEEGYSTVSHTASTLDKTSYRDSQLRTDSLEGAPKTLSLKEALELFRPDFISRSQGRVRRLEQRARRRKALQDSNPDLVQGLGEDRGAQKKNCTTPDPLSDNLFKPRERSISGREMQLRSRRIYNKLPEVTKKKEEEKKRAVSQTNRQRAEVFKKRLLDQILQR
ncbi:uncharacterized protein LOC103357685 [Stegastes partitus]|uniref:Uncharacterized protein LOC103357685 n=1 Tax=Stegastes partitus TaxID=144197 RepID=A0A9Y4N0N8_9TELE|nr:PREDICTED: uncharacterized protein LOC103357685 [Stegastes partitus]